VHYHIDRPPGSWPLYTTFRDEPVRNDLDLEFEEHETIRLYRLEDTLWEITEIKTWDGIETFMTRVTRS